MKKDFEWYKTDETGYMAEQDRRDKIVQAAFKKFMGPEFEKEPLQTAQEVEAAIKDRSTRLLRLRELKAPSLLVDNEQRMLEETMAIFQKGEYAVTQAELDYKEKYNEKQLEFNSQDHQWNWE